MRWTVSPFDITILLNGKGMIRCIILSLSYHYSNVPISSSRYKRHPPRKMGLHKYVVGCGSQGTISNGPLGRPSRVATGKHASGIIIFIIIIKMIISIILKRMNCDTLVLKIGRGKLFV